MRSLRLGLLSALLSLTVGCSASEQGSDEQWIGLPSEDGDLTITVGGELLPEVQTLHGFCQIGFNTVNLGTGAADLSVGLTFNLKRGENELPLRVDDDHGILNAELGNADYAGEDLRAELHDGSAHAGSATATLISDQAPTTSVEVEWSCTNLRPRNE